MLAEVGIAAAYGAWLKPWLINWPRSILDPAMQAQWFTDACHAATAATTAHQGGIYFWSLGLSVQQTGPTLADEFQWAHSAGASAISRCFASIEKAGRDSDSAGLRPRMPPQALPHALHPVGRSPGCR